MLTLGVLAQREIDPAGSHAADMELLDRAAGQVERAVLRVHDLAGEVLSLGRYHLAPSGDPTGGVSLHRRLGGGRLLPLGPGFAAVSLILPHRSALVARDPFALRPEQVLNRCVRGVLKGLRALGVDAFYPGRDVITVAGRMVGTVSLEVDARGAAAFEAMLAVDGDWLSLPRMVAAVDRSGVLAAEEVAADQVTTLAQLGARPTAEQLAGCLSAAYAKEFALNVVPGVPLEPIADPAAHADWIASRRRLPEMGNHAVTWAQLGVLEAYLSTQDGAIANIVVAGDFIADSVSLRRLEERLRGCALERAAVAAVVQSVYADPGSFLLGVGPFEILVDTIVRAA
jgi:lipoate-protein ligase A